MPDAASLDLGAPTGGGKGVPNWLMVVGAVAGIAGVVLLLRGSGGGGGTTAAGTSINAALGSIQEENMNLLGTTQAGFMQTNTNLGNLSTQMNTGFGNLSGQMDSGFGGMATLIGNSTTFLSNQSQSQFTDLTNQADTNYNNLSSQMGANYANLSQQQTDYLNAIQSHISDFQNQQAGALAGLTNQIASGQALNSAQYNELVGIQTNPWVKQLYENNIVSTLNPQQQGYYWNAVESMASSGHLQGANAGTY